MKKHSKSEIKPTIKPASGPNKMPESIIGRDVRLILRDGKPPSGIYISNKIFSTILMAMSKPQLTTSFVRVVPRDKALLFMRTSFNF